MRVWKILVLAPYALIAIAIGFSITMLQSASAGIGGITVGTAFLVFGLGALTVYTLVLCIALLLRWMIAKRRRSKT